MATSSTPGVCSYSPRGYPRVRSPSCCPNLLSCPSMPRCPRRLPLASPRRPRRLASSVLPPANTLCRLRRRSPPRRARSLLHPARLPRASPTNKASTASQCQRKPQLKLKTKPSGGPGEKAGRRDDTAAPKRFGVWGWVERLFLFCRGSFLQGPSFPFAPSPHKTNHDLYGQFLVGLFYKPVRSVLPR